MNVETSVVPPPGLSLPEAALWYAEKLSWPVFPVWDPTEDGGCSCPSGMDCPNPGKHPVTPSGLNSATTDPEVVRA